MQFKSEIEVDTFDLKQALSNYLTSKLGSNLDVVVNEIIVGGVSLTLPVVVKATLKKDSTSYMDR